MLTEQGRGVSPIGRHGILQTRMILPASSICLMFPQEPSQRRGMPALSHQRVFLGHTVPPVNAGSCGFNDLTGTAHGQNGLHLLDVTTPSPATSLRLEPCSGRLRCRVRDGYGPDFPDPQPGCPRFSPSREADCDARRRVPAWRAPDILQRIFCILLRFS